MTTRHVLMTALLAAIGLGGWVAQPATASAHDRHDGGTTYIYQPAPACRDYTRTVFEFGNMRISTGTACQRQDGNWYTVRETMPPRALYGAQPTRVVFVGDRRSGGYGGGRGWVRYDHDDQWRNRGNTRGRGHDHGDGNHHNRGRH